MPHPGGPSNISGVEYEQWFLTLLLSDCFLNPKMFVTPQLREIYTVNPVEKIQFAAIDDIRVEEKGNTSYYTIKQHAPNERWTASELIRSGIIAKIAKQHIQTPDADIILLTQSDSRLIREDFARAAECTTREGLVRELGNRIKDWDTLCSHLCCKDDELISIAKKCKIQTLGLAEIINSANTRFIGRVSLEDKATDILFNWAFTIAKRSRRVEQTEVIDYLDKKGIKLKSLYSSEHVSKLLSKASVSLENNPEEFLGIANTKIKRSETQQIFDWLISPLQIKNNIKDSPVLLLSGEAGMGKTTVLKHLYDELINSNIPVLGIKADRVDFTTQSKFRSELDLNDDLERILVSSTEDKGLTVVLIDQVDALSQSLSSDRNQILNYTGLIKRLSNISQIRIVVSCRIYDLNYDPVLTQLKSRTQIELKPFSDAQLSSVLTRLDIQLEHLTKNLKDLLTTPLHLDIFSLLNLTRVNLAKLKTLQSLYSELWKQKITNAPDLLKNGLSDFLAEVCQDMFKNQRIYSYHIDFEVFEREKQYLLSEGILRDTGELSRFSFFHQTLFDYSLARTFVMKGASISDEVIRSHQGLFLRNKVKAVMTFMREWKFDTYISEFRKILFSDSFRFHIKLLLINDLLHIDNPRKEENLLVSKLVEKEPYQSVVFESVNSFYWLSYLEAKIHQCLLNDFDEYRYLVLKMCITVMKKDEEPIFLFLESLPDFHRRVEFTSDVLTEVKDLKSESFKPIFIQSSEELRNRARGAQYYHFLSKSLKNWPEWTFEESFNDLKNSLLNDDKSNYRCEFLPHGAKQLYDSMESCGSDTAYEFFKRSLLYLLESTKWDFGQRFLITDRAFNSYHPLKKGIDQYHFIFPNAIIKYLIANSDSQQAFVEKELSSFLSSRFEVTVLIALEVLTQCPRLLANEGFEFIWSWLHSEKYIVGRRSTKHMLSYLNVLYPILSDHQAKKINRFILEYRDPIRNGNKAELNTYYGETQNFLIKSIPEVEKHTEIRKLEAELDRRLPIKKVLREKGNIREKIQVTHVRKDSVMKMSFENWTNFFARVINKYGGLLTWDRHYENVRSLREAIKESPNLHLKNIIHQFTNSQDIPSSYALAGIEGFYSHEPKNNELLSLLEVLTTRVDLSDYEIKEVIRLSTYFADDGLFSKNIFDWIIDNYETGTSQSSNSLLEDSGEAWVVNGRGSVKGASLSGLIHLAQSNDHAQIIFELLEDSSSNMEQCIRAVAVRELSYLNRFDKERSLNLFVKLSINQPWQIIEAGIWSLQFMSHINFNAISGITLKAINEIKSDQSIDLLGGILTLAGHYAYPKAEQLMELAFQKSLKFQLSALDMAIDILLEGRESEFLTKLLYRFLKEANHEFIYKYGSFFRSADPLDFLKWLEFIKEFTDSRVGKRRDSSYYDYLLKCCDVYPEQCIELVISSDSPKPDYRYSILQDEPLQLIINSYNSLGKYDARTQFNEMAMNAFDKVLKTPEYRRGREDFFKALDNY
jgi:DNA polymerase III delta prime subunit